MIIKYAHYTEWRNKRIKCCADICALNFGLRIILDFTCCGKDSHQEWIVQENLCCEYGCIMVKKDITRKCYLTWCDHRTLDITHTFAKALDNLVSSGIYHVLEITQHGCCSSVRFFILPMD